MAYKGVVERQLLFAIFVKYKGEKMLVKEIYNVLKKSEYWAIKIFDISGKVLLGYCNNSYKWEDVPEAVKYMTVEEISPCTDSLYLKADCYINAAYMSEERCAMDGYEKVYDDPQRGSIYAKEVFMLNPYNGKADSIGWTYSVVEGWQ